MFLEQKAEGLHVWQQPLTPLRAPLIFNIRTDPFERANEEFGSYEHWYAEHMFLMVPAQAIVAKEVQTFKDFPPRQKPGSFAQLMTPQRRRQVHSLSGWTRTKWHRSIIELCWSS